jgi:site-specific DNA-adenine methylase
MNQKQNTTSVSIPTTLLKQFSGKALVNTLKEFIGTTAKERKSLSVGEKNFKVENAAYRQLVDTKSQDRQKVSIRLFPTERQALKLLTNQKVLHNAITVALCAMMTLKDSRQNHSISQQPKPIYPATSYMGCKKWFTKMCLGIMDYIKNNFPYCKGYAEPFMGGGILVENVAVQNYFKNIVANYYDTNNLDYFQTIRTYMVFFKSLVLGLDYASSPAGEKNVAKSTAIITTSLEAMHPCKASKILDVLEFFLGQNKIITKSYKKQLSDLKNDPDVNPNISVRISIILECITNWKEKNAREYENKTGKKPKPQDISKYSTQAHGLHKKVDRLAEEAAALQQIRISNKDALAFLRKYAGNPEYVLVCDPPYFDSLEYEETFSYNEHIELAKLLEKHAKTGGLFIYFGRITAPRSNDTNASICYSERDKIYKGKYGRLFRGKGFFYKDFLYKKSTGIIERVVTNLELPDYYPY